VVRSAYFTAMWARIVVVYGLAVALVGCAGAEPAGAPAEAGPAPVAASGSPSGPPPVSVPASLAFTGRTVDGTPFDGAGLAGRPVVLWFWAPWCGTCAGQAATVVDARAKYGAKVSIVGVAGLGNLKAMKEFVSDLDVASVPHVDDQAGAIWRKFAITQQSTYVFLDTAGTIVHRGWLDSVAFDERLAALAR
jgi:thiol-disulfide isomerase/thioredoxin